MLLVPGPRMCHEFFFIITGILLSAQCCLGQTNVFRQGSSEDFGFLWFSGLFTLLTFANKP
jgi:hypothetical protein